ncbi:MAG: hypothetical protein ACRD4D_04535 [Candidatus Acidiferrales bacterium]
MPIDERNLRDILAEQEANIKRHVEQQGLDIRRHVGEQGEGIKRYVEEQVQEQDASLKRHVGVLVEETDRKFGIVSEGYQGLENKIDVELAEVRKELEEIRLHLFRKVDLDRLQAVEKRVDAIEKRLRQ